MKNKYSYKGEIITADSKEEAIQVVAGTNLCIDIDKDWKGGYYPNEYYLDGISKKDAYVDCEDEYIACKDKDIAEKIKARIAKKEGIDVSDIKTSRHSTSIGITYDEFTKWLSKTFKKSEVTYDDGGYGVECYKNLPDEVEEKIEEKDLDFSLPTLVHIEMDDFYETPILGEMKGIFKGSIDGGRLLYDPFKSDFNFGPIEKLIRSNLNVIDNMVAKYKEKKANKNKPKTKK